VHARQPDTALSTYPHDHSASPQSLKRRASACCSALQRAGTVDVAGLAMVGIVRTVCHWQKRRCGRYPGAPHDTLRPRGTGTWRAIECSDLEHHIVSFFRSSSLADIVGGHVDRTKGWYSRSSSSSFRRGGQGHQPFVSLYQDAMSWCTGYANG
jgi:hypothetical protein